VLEVVDDRGADDFADRSACYFGHVSHFC
jgi:hypothetical protein